MGDDKVDCSLPLALTVEEAAIIQASCQVVFFDVGQTLVRAHSDDIHDKIPKVFREELQKAGEPAGSVDEASFISTWWATKERHHKIKLEEGVAPSFDQLMADATAAMCGGVSAKPDSRKAAEEVIALLRANVGEAMTGAMPTIQALRQVPGLKLGIISNTSDTHKQVELMKHAGFDPSTFDTVVFSADIGHGKPHPEIFLSAMRSLNVAEPSQAVMVGDMLLQDISGAKKAGMRTVWFPTVAEKPAENEQHKDIPEYVPDATITDLHELPQALVKLLNK